MLAIANAADDPDADGHDGENEKSERDWLIGVKSYARRERLTYRPSNCAPSLGG
jgi:hypothetical protein